MEIYLDDLKIEVAKDILTGLGFSEKEIPQAFSRLKDVQIGELYYDVFDEIKGE